MDMARWELSQTVSERSLLQRKLQSERGPLFPTFVVHGHTFHRRRTMYVDGCTDPLKVKAEMLASVGLGLAEEALSQATFVVVEDRCYIEFATDSAHKAVAAIRKDILESCDALNEIHAARPKRKLRKSDEVSIRSQVVTGIDNFFYVSFLSHISPAQHLEAVRRLSRATTGILLPPLLWICRTAASTLKSTESCLMACCSFDYFPSLGNVSRLRLFR